MILVTGGTGLVGAHLLYHLTLQNDVVIAIFRSENSKKHTKNVFSLYTSDEKLCQKINWIQADITDVPSLENVFSSYDFTQVYHCAAMISFNPKDYKKMREINIGGTANIVNFCTEFNIQKMCFVSSIATLGTSINGKEITEEAEWNNEVENSEYAITKNGAEMEVWRASQEGIDAIIVNPGIILGSGFTSGSSEIFTKIKNGFNYYTKGVTGFIGVEDVVKKMILLMQSEVKNERFVLVSENKSFKDVFFTIADEFQVKKPSIKASKVMTSIFWRLDFLLTKITGKEPLLTKSSARASHNKGYYSSEKIKKTLPNIAFESVNNVIKKVCRNYS